MSQHQLRYLLFMGRQITSTLVLHLNNVFEKVNIPIIITKCHQLGFSSYYCWVQYEFVLFLFDSINIPFLNRH